MPSGLRETSKPQFEIYYEQPWGGVASDKDPVDISPNQLVTQEGVVAFNNALSSIALVADPNNFKFTPVNLNVPLLLFFSLGAQLYGIDFQGYIYVYSRGTGLFTSWVPTFPPTPPSDGIWTTGWPSAVIVVDGVAYISNWSRHSIYRFDGTTYTIATTYTGGSSLGILTDYMLALNTNSAVDGAQPTRINWSGPGKFSTWDPSVDRTAGFNTLPSVEESLTAFFSLSSIGLAITTKGVIQLAPTGVAISPFSFTELWTSDIGQGCIYPRTASQYGLRGYFFTDTGMYFLGAGSPTDVSGSAKRAILSTYQPSNIPAYVANAQYLTGSVFTYFFNSAFSSLYYALVGIAPSAVGAGYDIVIWFLDLSSGTWSSARYDIATLINRQFGKSFPVGSGFLDTSYNGSILNIQSLSVTSNTFGGLSSPVYPNSLTLLSAHCTSSAGPGSFTVISTLQLFAKYLTDDTINALPGNLNLVFRAEEIKLARKPTIRRVVIKAYGQGILNLSISGTSMGSITLDGTNNTKSYESTAGIYTGESPQLTITSSNFKGVIVKVMLAGTYADGDID